MTRTVTHRRGTVRLAGKTCKRRHVRRESAARRLPPEVQAVIAIAVEVALAKRYRQQREITDAGGPPGSAPASRDGS